MAKAKISNWDITKTKQFAYAQNVTKAKQLIRRAESKKAKEYASMGIDPEVAKVMSKTMKGFKGY